jgi:hypothetical protein
LHPLRLAGAGAPGVQRQFVAQRLSDEVLERQARLAAVSHCEVSRREFPEA